MIKILSILIGWNIITLFFLSNQFIESKFIKISHSSFNLFYFITVKILSCDFFVHFNISSFFYFSLFFGGFWFLSSIFLYRSKVHILFLFPIIKILFFVFQFSILTFYFFHFIFHYFSFISFSVIMLKMLLSFDLFRF